MNELLHVSRWRGFGLVVINWGLIAAAMALVAAWPNPLTVVAALFVIGARQLGLAVGMHEAAHRTLLKSRRLNDWVGSWLCAYPIWSDCHAYRPYHLQHHAKTGSPEDPDIGLIRPFPITRQSLRRKIVRDLTGQTGLKFARAAFRRSFGQWRQSRAARRAATGFALSNGVLLAVLLLVGHPALYLLWALAFLTTHTLVTRIRAIAEHALTPSADDPMRNTRTTLLHAWERLLVGPNRVNFHLEHHLLMTVPHYNLPRMHRLLRERGALDHACIEPGGYLPILRHACSAASPAES